MCPRASVTTSCPDRVCSLTATWLPIVPDGTNRAASLARISAARSCSRRTVGSSRKTSSPTSASAIALRISAVGVVTVSLLRSITLVCPPLRSPFGLQTRFLARFRHGRTRTYTDVHGLTNHAAQSGCRSHPVDPVLVSKATISSRVGIDGRAPSREQARAPAALAKRMQRPTGQLWRTP